MGSDWLYILGALLAIVSRVWFWRAFTRRFPEGGVILGTDGAVKGSFRNWHELRRVLLQYDGDVIVSAFPPSKADYLRPQWRMTVQPPGAWIPRSPGGSS